jgi:hypothetical protein
VAYKADQQGPLAPQSYIYTGPVDEFFVKRYLDGDTTCDTVVASAYYQLKIEIGRTGIGGDCYYDYHVYLNKTANDIGVMLQTLEITEDSSPETGTCNCCEIISWIAAGTGCLSYVNGAFVNLSFTLDPCLP